MSKIIIITAPSGSGKTTIVKQLLEHHPQLAFSVSACTRTARNGEKDGIDYYFLKEDDFKKKIEGKEFLEWEMVYPGKYYGTLKNEITRLWDKGQTPIIDIDVKGALKVKDNLKENAISIFIKTPSLEILKHRLLKRATEDEKSLQERLDKATLELSFEQFFDFVVVNDDLENAINATAQIIGGFLNNNN